MRIIASEVIVSGPAAVACTHCGERLDAGKSCLHSPTFDGHFCDDHCLADHRAFAAVIEADVQAELLEELAHA